MIDASTATSPVTLDNGLVLNDGASVKITGDVTFSAAVTAAGSAAAVNTVSSEDKVTFGNGVMSGLTNTPKVTLDGTGTFTIDGSVELSVDLIYGPQNAGSTGKLFLDTNLGGLLGIGPGQNPQQLKIQGGTVIMVSVTGVGGIDVLAGKLEAGSADNYQGTITLEQTPSDQPVATLVIGDNASFGTGKLKIAGPTTSGTNAPVIDTSAATSRVTINNTLELLDGAVLNVGGIVTFSQAVVVDGAGAMNTIGSGDKLDFADGLIPSAFATPTMTLDGPGTITMGGPVAPGVLVVFGKQGGTTGVLDLQSNLGGVLGEVLKNDSQVTVKSGTVSLNGLSGGGGIDLFAGYLQAGSADNYIGNITLEQGASGQAGPTVVIADNATLGSGELIVAGPSPDPTGVPRIDATSATSGAGVTLNNSLVMKDAASVVITGNVTFTAAASATGTTAAITTAASTDQLAFSGGLTTTLDGSPNLLLDGPGYVSISQTVSVGVRITYGSTFAGTTGQLVLSANLGGLLGEVDPNASQVLVQGGTVMLSGVSGAGGIEMQTGTLVAGPADSYTGSITLDQSAADKPGPIVRLADGTSLGSGNLVVNGPAVLASSVPTIDASAALSTVTLANTLVMQASSVLNVAGSVTFSAAVSVVDPSAEINTLNNTDKLTFAGGLTTSLNGTPTLGLDGPGTTAIGGTVSTGVQVLYGASLTGTSGQLVLGAFLGGLLGNLLPNAGQVTVQGGAVSLQGLSGHGGIALQSGVLSSGDAADYAGNITLGQTKFGAGAAIVAITSGTSLGTGNLQVMASDSGANTSQINATGTVTLDNVLVLQDGAAVNISGNITFTQAVSVPGSTAAVNTLASTDLVVFQGGITPALTNTNALTLDGPGTLGIGGTISVGVEVIFGPQSAGSTGALVLGCNLGGLLGTIDPNQSQVVLQGGRLAFEGVLGNGGVDVKGGTLIAQSGAPDYDGTVTLETGGTISVTENADTVALGTGTLRLLGGTLLNESGGTAVLANNVSVQGTVDVTSIGSRLKFSGNVDLTLTGEFDAHGSVAVTGSLTGPGVIRLEGDDFDLSGTNTGYSGTINWDAGTVEVTSNDALGLGKVIVNVLGQVIMQAVNSIGDPILDNPFTLNTGTLVLEGQFTFPNGIVIMPGAVLKVQGADTQVIVSGPLSGGGEVEIDSGTFAATGDQSGFTGTILDLTGKFIPTITVADAGGMANGSPYPATITLIGMSGTPTDALDGVTPTATYYVGPAVTGSGSTTPPTAAGTYTVVASFAGSDNYAAAQSDPVTFVITPAPKLVAPTITSPVSATVNENHTLTFAASRHNAIAVADSDANGTTEQLTLTVTHGRLKLKSTSGLRIVGGANGSSSISVVGTLANLNKALNGLTYTPGCHFAGDDQLALSIKDHDGLITSASVALVVQTRKPRSRVGPKVRLTVSPCRVVRGEKVEIKLDSVDPRRFSPDHRLSYHISFGDGTSTTFVGGFDTSWSHEYKRAGSFTISVTATDQTGHTSRVVSQQVSVVAGGVGTDPFRCRKSHYIRLRHDGH